MCILICHAPAIGIALPKVVFILMGYGNVGVDIFLLLSGVGCVFSLQRKPALTSWYKKRFVRILIPYFIIQIPFWCFQWFVGKFYLLKNLYILSTVAFWLDHVGAWYVALLLPLYTVTPLLFYLLDRYSLKTFVVLSLLIFVFFYLEWTIVFQDNQIWHNVQWASKRAISFIIGMYIAPWVKQHKVINSYSCIIFFGILWYLARTFLATKYFLWLLEFPILIVLTKLMNLNNMKVIRKLFVWFGTISLESYLANIYLNGNIYSNHYIQSFIKENTHADIIIYLMIIIVGTFLAYLTHILSEKLLIYIKH